MVAGLFRGDYKKYTVLTLIMLIAALGAGFLWHFLFELSKDNFFVGLFTPVNESVWEHLKLLFFPFILTMIIEYFIYGKDVYNFFSSKLFGISVGIITVITNYYTTVGAFGINNMAVNIGIFIFSVIISYILSYYRMIKGGKIGGGLWESASIFILAIYFSLFLIFTYYPPHIPLFRDPTTMNYSIFK